MHESVHIPRNGIQPIPQGNPPGEIAGVHYGFSRIMPIPGQIMIFFQVYSRGNYPWPDCKIIMWLHLSTCYAISLALPLAQSAFEIHYIGVLVHSIYHVLNCFESFPCHAMMHVINFHEFIDIVITCRAFTWFFFSHKHQYLSKIVNFACPILKPIPKHLMETDYLNFNNLLDNKHHKLCQVTSMKLFLHEVVFLWNWTISKAPSSSWRCGFYGSLLIYLIM
jgi:hypothetical protein